MRIFILVLLFFFASCTPYEKEPELKDPDFNASVSEVAENEKENEAKIDECKKLYVEAESSAPQTGLRASVLEKWKACTEKQALIAQKLRYSKVVMETKRVKAAEDYSKSLKTGEQWPPTPKNNVPHGTSH